MRATFASLQTFFIRLSEMRIGLPTLDSWQIALFLPTGFGTCPRTCRSTIPQMVHHLGYHHILWLTCIATAIWELSDCTVRSYLPRSPLPEEIGKSAWLYATHLLRKFVAFKRLFWDILVFQGYSSCKGASVSQFMPLWRARCSIWYAYSSLYSPVLLSKFHRLR